MKKLLLLVLVTLVWGCGGKDEVEQFEYEHTVKNVSQYTITIKESGNTLTLNSKATGRIRSKNLEPKIEVIGQDDKNRDIYWELEGSNFLYLIEVYENEVTYEASGTSPKASISYRENGQFKTEEVSLPWKKDIKKLGGNMAMMAVVPTNLGSTVNWKIYYQGELKEQGSSNVLPIDGSYFLPTRFYLSRN